MIQTTGPETRKGVGAKSPDIKYNNHMEINGKKLQEDLLPRLVSRVEKLKSQGINPGIAIVTLGPEVAWEAYVSQKIKLAKKLGIHTNLQNLRPETTDDVLRAIETLNNENTIHGLIVQRPFPIYIDTEKVIQSVSKEKDIDGFRNDSEFDVPVFLAVKHLLTHMSQLLGASDFTIWLSNQSILIVGRGETAGFPIAKALSKMKITPAIMDTKTQNRDELFEQADIIIVATGKRVAIPFEKLKKTSILIGIGLHRVEGALRGDFDENEAKRSILYYTPSPGGVGPLNLYYLFDNLITACERSLTEAS